MSNVAVFAVGLLVTLLVAGATFLLIWGAVLDGREDDERGESCNVPLLGYLSSSRPILVQIPSTSGPRGVDLS